MRKTKKAHHYRPINRTLQQERQSLEQMSENIIDVSEVGSVSCENS